MSNISELIRSANPVPEMNPLSDDEVNAVLTLTMTRSGEMDIKEAMTPVDPDRKRSGWLVAAAAFGAVIIVAGLAIALTATGNTGDDITPAGVDDNPAVTTQPPTTTATPTTEASAAAQATTTTQVATTTTTVPSIENGRYSVPDEIAPDTYRLWYSASRLDENMELIDTYLVGEGAIGIVIVQPTDAYLLLDGTMVTVEDFGRPVDPVAESLPGGAYLVGYDLEPGQYRVHPADSGVAWWKLRDDAMQITEADEGGTSLDVTVKEGDFVLEYRGLLVRLP